MLLVIPFLHCSLFGVKILITADGSEKEIVTSSEIKEGISLYVPILF